MMEKLPHSRARNMVIAATAAMLIEEEVKNELLVIQDNRTTSVGMKRTGIGGGKRGIDSNFEESEMKRKREDEYTTQQEEENNNMPTEEEDKRREDEYTTQQEEENNIMPTEEEDKRRDDEYTTQQEEENNTMPTKEEDRRKEDEYTTQQDEENNTMPTEEEDKRRDDEYTTQQDEENNTMPTEEEDKRRGEEEYTTQKEKDITLRTDRETIGEEEKTVSKWELCGGGGGGGQLMRMKLRRVSTVEQNESKSDSSSEDLDDYDEDPDFSVTSSSASSSTEDVEPENKINNMDDEMDNMTDKKKGKKLIANPSEWKKNKTKLLRNHGKAYKSVSNSKKEMKERQMRSPCNEKCRLQCSTKIDEDKRHELFDKYWALPSLMSQREFISRSMTKVQPAYQYKKENSRRTFNHAFYFQVNDKQIRVCKHFFKSTLDINDRPIRTVIQKLKDGFMEQELRGKHSNHKKVDPILKEGAYNHINSIPRVESHYLRAQSSRQYIDGGKTLADLFRDYVKECDNKNIPHVNITMYSRIFNHDFNLSFFTPKKDQCDLCMAYHNATDKDEMKPKYEEHLKEKVSSREEKERDKKKSMESNNLIVATYDLQAVLPVPRGDVSVFYYKCKLNCYNFTINELNRDKVDCFFWHEGEGKRGAVEIGSCILKYLEELAQKTNDDNLEVIFYSDNCCGQQKNKYIMGLYLYAVQTLQIKSITHKFLIRGHTQNEGDNVHAVIEKAVKRALKSGPIYVPGDYIRIIQSARKTGNSYNVIEMNYSDFIDLKDLTSQVGLQFNETIENEDVKTGDIKVMKVQKSDPGVLYVKTSFDQTVYKTIAVNNTRRRNRSMPSKIQRVQAYKRNLEIGERKKSDIQGLIDANHIPRSFKPIYDSIFK